jgi:single-stranded-DNA-specific exonuclease
MNKKDWIIAPKINEDFKSKFPEISPLILQLLFNRGLTTQKQIDEFLMPEYSQHLYDPFLFKDMQKAAERLGQAIDNKEKVLIYGDYDVDGVTSSAILKLTIDKFGGTSDVYLPDREKEGYGMKEEVVAKAAKDKVGLIVTCDCGITGVKEIDLANKLGIDVIVTDHHLPSPAGGLPQAYAIINPHCEPNYPFKYLAGVGVAFKLIQGLLLNPAFNNEAFEKWLLDLVALGTVADRMPLLDENRALAKYGLIVLNKTQRIGLRALCQAAGLEMGDIDTRNIEYQIAPRINVASRMDHASIAFALLMSKNQPEAEKLAQDLNRINTQRQKLVEEIIQQLKNELGEEPAVKAIVVQGEKWPAGILSLISGKLIDEYHRPSFALNPRKEDVKGSARSIEEFNLVETLNTVSHLFSRFGGHRMAAGFTIKNKELVPEFIKTMQQLAEDRLKDVDLSKKLFIDAEVKLEELGWETEEALEKFVPFGEGNRRPLFLVKDLKIENLQRVGQNSQHLKLIAGGKKFILFCANGKCDNLRIGDMIDVVTELGVNEWNGTKELQMKIIDLKINS